MDSAYVKLVGWLFETGAIRVCPKNKPFWYTSGTIGPYYVNTHFLYGSEEKANELLEVIDREKDNVVTCPAIIRRLAIENYKTNRIYCGVIDLMLEYIKANFDISEIECISGGERRDWFFSLAIAHFLKKPHIAVFKNLIAVISENGTTSIVEDLQGRKVLHVADLLTEASSFERLWIPAIRNRNGRLEWSLVVVDRKQGGAEKLAESNIRSHAMLFVDKNLFQKALHLQLIDAGQYSMISEYIDNPRESMIKFLNEHPDFLEESLESDEKTRERARFCIEKNIYGRIMHENILDCSVKNQ